MDGKGVFKWPDGRVYDGEYKNDKKDGYGILITPKFEYRGYWKNGKMDGEGEII